MVMLLLSASTHSESVLQAFEVDLLVEAIGLEDHGESQEDEDVDDDSLDHSSGAEMFIVVGIDGHDGRLGLDDGLGGGAD
jgi:hypothetical protein